MGSLKDDETCTKTLNFQHSFFVFHHSSVYFIFVGKKELTDDKLFNFYLDLKKDLTQACKGSLYNLQDQELSDGFYQRQLQPKLELRLSQY